MSTRSFVAFRDGETTTGIYVHSDGYPEGRVPVLREIYTATFFRDLAQMRTTLLKHAAGWSALSTNADWTAGYAVRLGHGLDVPGVGVAYTDDEFDMTATGDKVFAEEYAYVFDLADKSLSVYASHDQIWHAPETAWAPIGPLCLTATLPIVAADPPGELCLTGKEAAYTEGHISRLIHRLDGEGGFFIGDGLDLARFFDAAAAADLLPADCWFIADGYDARSEGGWIRLPYELEGVDIQAMFIQAADFTTEGLEDWYGGPDKVPGTRVLVRTLLEYMQSRIATAVRSIDAWRAPDKTYVLNIQHPYEQTQTDSHGPAPEVHTLTVGSHYDWPPDASEALKWTANQVMALHDWPLPLRRTAHTEIRRAIRGFPAARDLASVLVEQTVDPTAVDQARFAAGWLAATSNDTERAADADGFLAVMAHSTGYESQCRQAATSQGLDPIRAALDAAGVDYDIDQTGGFCMVVRVPTPHGFHFGITASESNGVDPSRHWLVLRRSDTDFDDEGEVIGFAVPTPDVIALLAGHLSAADDTTAPKAVSLAVNTAVDWLKDELGIDEGAVDDLLNLVVNAAVHAAEHPENGTLEVAIRANYDEGDGCQECDDPDDCDDPEHDGTVDEVLGWLAELR